MLDAEHYPRLKNEFRRLALCERVVAMLHYSLSPSSLLLTLSQFCLAYSSAMILQTLSALVLCVIVLAAPVVDNIPGTNENMLCVPIYNRNSLNLSTVYAMDVARWIPLANISLDQFAAQAATGVIIAPAINILTSYLLQYSLGTPAQPLEPIFDTGSALLWIRSSFYRSDRSFTHYSLFETFVIEYGTARDVRHLPHRPH